MSSPLFKFSNVFPRIPLGKDLLDKSSTVIGVLLDALISNKLTSDKMIFLNTVSISCPWETVAMEINKINKIGFFIA